MAPRQTCQTMLHYDIKRTHSYFLVLFPSFEIFFLNTVNHFAFWGRYVCWSLLLFIEGLLQLLLAHSEKVDHSCPKNPECPCKLILQAQPGHMRPGHSLTAPLNRGVSFDSKRSSGSV